MEPQGEGKRTKTSPYMRKEVDEDGKNQVEVETGTLPRPHFVR